MLKLVHLKKGDTLVVALKVCDTDQPWFICDFEPTNAFEKYNHFLEDDDEELDEAQAAKTSRMLDPTDLTLINAETGEILSEGGFILQVLHDYCWFRY